MQLVFVLAFLSLLSCALGAIYDRLANLNQDSFDFVIVGGKSLNISSHGSSQVHLFFRRNCWCGACESTVRGTILPGLGRRSRSKVC